MTVIVNNIALTGPPPHLDSCLLCGENASNLGPNGQGVQVLPDCRHRSPIPWLGPGSLECRACLAGVRGEW